MKYRIYTILIINKVTIIITKEREKETLYSLKQNSQNKYLENIFPIIKKKQFYPE